MKRVLLLSDLWGRERSEWLSQYTELLESHFELAYYDCQDLGKISGKGLTEEALHSQFVNGGMETAVERLLEREKEVFAILGFSVGGYIGWKACLAGLKALHLISLSSTRLRYETEKPDSRIILLYGETDNYRPESCWFEQLEIQEYTLQGEGHALYMKKQTAETVCQQLIALL